MTVQPGSGVILGLSLVALSFFVLGVTAFNQSARDNDTWKALATAIILTGLLEFSAFTQQALLRQQEAQLGAIKDGKVTE